jgi:hypothetical protein
MSNAVESRLFVPVALRRAVSVFPEATQEGEGNPRQGTWCWDWWRSAGAKRSCLIREPRAARRRTVGVSDRPLSKEPLGLA